VCNKKFPLLYELLKELINFADPTFKFTSIQVNQNVSCSSHRDMSNVGESLIIGFGDYDGGYLVIDHGRGNDSGTRYNIQRNFFRFCGNQSHWTEPWDGFRATVIFYTHKQLVGLVVP